MPPDVWIWIQFLSRLPFFFFIYFIGYLSFFYLFYWLRFLLIYFYFFYLLFFCLLLQLLPLFSSLLRFAPCLLPLNGYEQRFPCCWVGLGLAPLLPFIAIATSKCCCWASGLYSYLNKNKNKRQQAKVHFKCSFLLFNKKAFYYFIKVCFYLFGIKASRTLKGITQTISNRFNLPM